MPPPVSHEFLRSYEDRVAVSVPITFAVAPALAGAVVVAVLR